MKEKIDIDQILEKHYTKHGLGLFKLTYPKLFYANQQAIKEIVERTLAMAADEAYLTTDLRHNVSVDKESILSTINQIKF